jgi:hypothetical protein
MTDVSIIGTLITPDQPNITSVGVLTSLEVSGVSTFNTIVSNSMTVNGSGPIALGNLAGSISQQTGAIAIGNNTGLATQGENAVAIGTGAGQTNQGPNSVAIGVNAGNFKQFDETVAIGFNAGQTNQSLRGVAIGYNVGQMNQGTATVAIGEEAGRTNQGENAIALGLRSGALFQGLQAVAIGTDAGQNTQSFRTIAIGNTAGKFAQRTEAIAIGNQAGINTQGAYAIAIGSSCAENFQGTNSIAIGLNAGDYTQGMNAIAIGTQAGQTNQGSGSIAIGYLAGSRQASNSIVINASGSVVTGGSNNSTYIAPIRNVIQSNILGYNTLTNEITYFTQSGSSVSPQMAFFRLASGQNIPNNSTTTVLFSGISILNNIPNFTYNSTTGVFTLGSTGLYTINYVFKWASNTTGNREGYVQWSSYSNVFFARTITSGNVASGQNQESCFSIVATTNNTTMNVNCLQSSGGNLILLGESDGTGQGTYVVFTFVG